MVETIIEGGRFLVVDEETLNKFFSEAEGRLMAAIKDLKPAVQDQFVEIKVAAEVIHRHPCTLRRWVKAGMLTARKLGGKWYVDRKELNDLVGGIRHGTD